MSRGLRSHVPLVLWACLTAIIAFSAGSFARHHWVEPFDVASVCDAGASTALCTLRRLIIEAFVQQRLAWAAMLVAAIACATRSGLASVLSLAMGSAALVLYSADVAAPACLLSLACLALDSSSGSKA
jgi:hypothetical protein